jgi:hypothetical protein
VSSAHVARRRRASCVPSITAIKLTPSVGEATLVNISASGVLVECASRVAPGTLLTVRFLGTFSPASAEGRVARCLVAGIGKDGAIRYHIGIAFTQMIPFDVDEAPATSVSSTEFPPPQPPQEPAPPPPVIPEAAEVHISLDPVPVRNRW